MSSSSIVKGRNHVIGQNPMSIESAFLLLLSITSCAVCATDRQHGSSDTPPVTIEHVTVLPMTAGGPRVLLDATVVLRNGRIAWVGAPGPGLPATAAKIPHDVRRVNGAGKWLMPALVDCHVHVENDRLLRLLLQSPSIPDGTVNTADILLPRSLLRRAVNT
jgi:adenine deaminase